MNVTPVIIRELRAEARNPLNHRLRVLALVPVLFVCWLVTTEARGNVTRQGSYLFIGIQFTLVALVCLVGPTLTADCLSREKREGTLGLLFLTPLTPGAIVVGKSFVHLLRALTLWLAVVPVMTIPFLLGGLTWAGVARAMCMQFALGLLALAAGLLASAYAKSFVRALVLAMLLNVTLWFVLGGCLVVGLVLLGAGLPQTAFPRGYPPVEDLLAVAFLVLLELLHAATPPMRGFGVITPVPVVGVLTAEAVLFALVVFLLIVARAAHRLKQSQRDEPPSAEQLRLRATLFAPRFWTGRFRRTMSRRLAQNPTLWLQTYSPTARLVKWGWCFVVVLYACLLATGTYPAGYFRDTYAVVLWLLLLGMAFSAANSFRQERESGALELLLIAPLKEKQIIGGRTRGLWSQYLPAVGMFLVLTWLMSWVSVYNPPWYGPDPRMDWWRYLLVLGALPVVGLFFSLRLQFQLLATAAGLFLGAAWPLSMPGMVSYFVKRASFYLNYPFDELVPRFLVTEGSCFWFLLTLSVVTGLCGYQLHRDLVRRNFVLRS